VSARAERSCAVAERHRVTMIVGISERVSGPRPRNLNSLLVIAPDGAWSITTKETVHIHGTMVWGTGTLMS
jgi:hypothetical protein